MKILHVLPALAKGGAERVVIELANFAADEGHEVTILASVAANRELGAEDLRPAVDLRFVIPKDLPARRAYPGLVPWLRRNRNWVLAQDVVHCHLTLGTVFGSLVQVIRGKRTTPVVVETYHAVGMAISHWRRASHSFFLTWRDAVVFMARDPYWEHFRDARPRGLFRTILNGIAPPGPRTKANRIAKSIQIPRHAVVVGSIGRLLYERRPDLILRAFADLARFRSLESHLLMGGTGPELTKLSREVQRLGLGDRVHFPGLVLDPIEHLQMIDVYLTINVGEVTGIAALEAVFAGVPVVAVQLQTDYNVSASDWVWSSPDPEEVAKEMARLLADTKELRALAERQMKHALAHRSVKSMANAYYRLYEDALARRRASRGIRCAGYQR